MSEEYHGRRRAAVGIRFLEKTPDNLTLIQSSLSGNVLELLLEIDRALSNTNIAFHISKISDDFILPNTEIEFVGAGPT